jgi:2-polyprenyl-3-methyl-5-hydroxy-6-metoxy-1,4-benzoquinol methylase
LSEWWQTFFDDGYLAAGFGPIKRRRTLADIRFIEKALSPKKGSSILDVCCGVGRHALELARLGFKVTGVDLSEAYIEVARRRAKKRGLRAVFEAHDIRKLPFEAKFDSAICMWTSFGYFENDADNLKTLRRVHKALKPGGKFLIELINRDWLIVNFEAVGWHEIPTGYILEKRTLDALTSRLNAEWIYLRKESVARRRLSLRLYSVHELVAVLERAGFTLDALFGDRVNRTPTWHDRMTAALVRK